MCALHSALCNGCQIFYCSILQSVDQMLVMLQNDKIAQSFGSLSFALFGFIKSPSWLKSLAIESNFRDTQKCLSKRGYSGSNLLSIVSQ